MTMQIVVATGACAMGGCQHPCPGVKCIPRRESTLVQAKTFGEMYQVVEHLPLVLGFVAIGSQAV